MNGVSIARHRTALSRSNLSRPVRLALEDGLINQDTEVFDYGCGRGTDISELNRRNITCKGWDPVHRPDEQQTHADIVNLGYVVNVIENAKERITVLQEAWKLTRKLLIVSARLFIEAKDNHTAYEDGCLTRLGTFQKFYEQQELKNWINSVLGVTSVPVAPGVFYIFRDDTLRESYLASRYRRKTAAPRQLTSDRLFEEHKSLFDPLMEFIATRGRLPDETEFELAQQVQEKIGSLKRAFGIIRQVTGTEQWEKIREERAQDILLYLALARFDGRPRFSQLPRDLQFDVRAFFSTYSNACDQADELLFSVGDLKKVHDACRLSPVGKQTPTALYIHISALQELPPILRVYEGCARALVGTVEGANIIKLHRDVPQISYLLYPDFERDPHPALNASLLVHLQTFRIKYREYTDSKNPPILHRKEEFIAKGHPLHPKFKRLTEQEEKWGLYESTQAIGTREGWETLLCQKSIQLSGHRLTKTKTRG